MVSEAKLFPTAPGDNEGIMKLHLGCGDRELPGFTQCDIRPLRHADYVTSADKLGMFESDSVDLIYACHLLEHFGRNEIERVLREWHRVLKPGGVLRLAVPDFEAVVQVYLKYRDMGLLLGLLVGRQDYLENTHRMVFDFDLLSGLLAGVGFRNIHRYDWRETIHKDYDDFSQAYIPAFQKTTGILVSLNMEAEK